MYHLENVHGIVLITGKELIDSSNLSSDDESLERTNNSDHSQLQSSNSERSQKFGKIQQTRMDNLLINLVVQDNRTVK